MGEISNLSINILKKIGSYLSLKERVYMTKLSWKMYNGFKLVNNEWSIILKTYMINSGTFNCSICGINYHRIKKKENKCAICYRIICSDCGIECDKDYYYDTEIYDYDLEKIGNLCIKKYICNNCMDCNNCGICGNDIEWYDSCRCWCTCMCRSKIDIRQCNKCNYTIKYEDNGKKKEIIYYSDCKYW